MKQILIIEDDENLGKSLKKIMEAEGMVTHLATSLAKARELASDTLDVIVLDWMLPDGQGIDFLRELRAKNKTVPVIMLTARTDLIDKVLGLETGASDYMTKPFESRELVARVRVQLREKNISIVREEKIVVGKIVINSLEKEVLYDGKRVAFTKMEYELLKILAENPRQTFSREKLLDKVWGYENFPTTRTVDTHVLQIRQKTFDEVIETIRGLGYRLGSIESA
ncbi:MAG: response regulator transcription factor [Bacteriovorax sp.]|nr:response regulator transcription factor [Bacteriovorax sp.]